MFRLAAGLAMLAASPGAASAQQERLYLGKAGTAPIVLQLDESADSPSGKYFYRRTRFDIDLWGVWDATTLRLESRLTGDKLLLHRAGGGLEGTLTTAKGNSLPVTLAPAAAEAGPAGVPADLDGYQRMRLAGLGFTAGAVERIGDRTIRWYSQPQSTIRLFRIDGGYPPSVLARINAALAARQWREVDNWFACPGNGGAGSGIESDTASKPYLGASFVSYFWQSSWYCEGTAHPDFGLEGQTFDARTGAAVGLDDLLRFGAGPVPAEESDAWYSYRDNRFGPGLVRLMKRYHPREMRPATGEDCDYADAEIWKFPAWYLTAKGLYVGAVFGRAARACDSPDWSIIPWGALNGPGTRR